MDDDGTERHFRSCNLCEANCGIILHHRAGEIVSVSGDADDPLSRGHICAKALALADVHTDADRLRRPLKRTPSGWVEMDWEEALDQVAHELRSIQECHGNDAVGSYFGNPLAHNHGVLLLRDRFLKALGGRSRFSAVSCDGLPHMLAAEQMFGHYLGAPIPDIDRTGYFLCFGGNPIVSNGSFMTAPGFRERARRLRARGGRLVVFDPRRTETAKIADEHHFVRPGTDCLVLLAMLNSLFSRGLVQPGELAERLEGLDDLAQACATFTPAAVSETTGVAAEVIEQVAADFAAAPAGIVYGRIGIATSEFGSLSAFLIYALNVVTGNVDRPGGLMFTLPVIDIVGLSAAMGNKGGFGRWRSRVSDRPEFAGELPCATLGEEIDRSGAGQIRAMVVVAGNPVLSIPSSGTLDRSFANLDLLVSIDYYVNETSRHAHFILPPSSPLERSHYALTANCASVRNVVKYSPPLFKPARGTLHEWEIIGELTMRLAPGNPVARWWRRMSWARIRRKGDGALLGPLIRWGPYGRGILRARVDDAGQAPHPREDRAGRPSAGRPRAMRAPILPSLRYLINATCLGRLGHRWPGNRGLRLDLEQVRAHPHGIDLGPLVPMLAARLFRRSNKIAVMPAMYLDELTRARQRLARGHDPAFDLLLIGRRDVRSNNSWMHNSARLTKGKDRCTLLISPQDAAARGLADGGLALVRSRTAQITLPATVDCAMMPGVVSMPHGWGHHRKGMKLSVATRRPGFSMNDLIGAEADPLSATALLNGIPVQVMLANTVEVPGREGGQGE